MPRFKLLKYKKRRRTLESYKVQHNPVFSYIKGAKNNIGRDTQIKYYGKTHDIEYVKIFGKRKLSVPGLCGFNDVYNLYTESCRRRKHVTPMCRMYNYSSMCVHH